MARDAPRTSRALKAHLITAEKNIALALKDRAAITEE